MPACDEQDRDGHLFWDSSLCTSGKVQNFDHSSGWTAPTSLSGYSSVDGSPGAAETSPGSYPLDPSDSWDAMMLRLKCEPETRVCIAGADCFFMVRCPGCWKATPDDMSSSH